MSEIKVDNLTGKTTANDITVTVGATATQSLGQGLAKAWVLGTDAAVLTKSFNIASGLDNDNGDYTYSFTNSMDSANFVVGNSIAQSNTGGSHNDSRTSSNYRVSYTDAGFGRANRVNNSSVHGDLA
jgi:hypothetical protein